jgi:hypothetical protein
VLDGFRRARPADRGHHRHAGGSAGTTSARLFASPHTITTVLADLADPVLAGFRSVEHARLQRERDGAAMIRGRSASRSASAVAAPITRSGDCPDASAIANHFSARRPPAGRTPARSPEAAGAS